MAGYERWTGAFHALSDETRLRIFLMLSDGERCACRIQEAFCCTQPTISYHMRVLTRSGLVHSRREGAMTCYAADEEAARAVRALLAVIGPAQEEEDHGE